MQASTSSTESRQPELHAAIDQFPVHVEVENLAALESVDGPSLAELARRAIDGASPKTAARILASLGERQPDLDYGIHALSIVVGPTRTEVSCEFEELLTVETGSR